eukprot:gene4865-6192_t
MTALDTFTVVYENTYIGSQETKQAKCSTRYPAMSFALFVSEAMLLVGGCVLCWLAKGVPDV